LLKPRQWRRAPPARCAHSQLPSRSRHTCTCGALLFCG
jgi:hypothetical protein